MHIARKRPKSLASVDGDDLAGDGSGIGEVAPGGNDITWIDLPTQGIEGVHRGEVRSVLARRGQHQRRRNPVDANTIACERARRQLSEPGERLLRQGVTEEIGVGRGELRVQQIHDERVATAVAHGQCFGEQHRCAQVHRHVRVELRGIEAA